MWQPEQSRLYLMNTQAFYPTLIPEDAELAPPLAGGSFDQWRELRRRDGIGLNDAEKAELATLESHDFPSRALYGRY
ncbi:FAD/NAD(P)-binding protein, partial [Paraburkholderia sp. SIMBA_030]